MAPGASTAVVIDAGSGDGSDGTPKDDEAISKKKPDPITKKPSFKDKLKKQWSLHSPKIQSKLKGRFAKVLPGGGGDDSGDTNAKGGKDGGDGDDGDGGGMAGIAGLAKKKFVGGEAVGDDVRGMLEGMLDSLTAGAKARWERHQKVIMLAAAALYGSATGSMASTMGAAAGLALFAVLSHDEFVHLAATGGFLAWNALLACAYGWVLAEGGAGGALAADGPGGGAAPRHSVAAYRRRLVVGWLGVRDPTGPGVAAHFALAALFALLFLHQALQGLAYCCVVKRSADKRRKALQAWCELVLLPQFVVARWNAAPDGGGGGGGGGDAAGVVLFDPASAGGRAAIRTRLRAAGTVAMAGVRLRAHAAAAKARARGHGDDEVAAAHDVAVSVGDDAAPAATATSFRAAGLAVVAAGDSPKIKLTLEELKQSLEHWRRADPQTPAEKEEHAAAAKHAGKEHDAGDRENSEACRALKKKRDADKAKAAAAVSSFPGYRKRLKCTDAATTKLVTDAFTLATFSAEERGRKRLSFRQLVEWVRYAVDGRASVDAGLSPKRERALRQLFDAVDADGDGTLTLREIDAWAASPASYALKRAVLRENPRLAPLLNDPATRAAAFQRSYMYEL